MKIPILIVIIMISFSTLNVLAQVKDADYQSVKIDNQEWMIDNLDVTRFRNGDLIDERQGNYAWFEASRDHIPAWCYIVENGITLGKMYNYYAVKDKRGLAPNGWKIANDKEWQNLSKSLNPNVFRDNSADIEKKLIRNYGGYRDLEGWYYGSEKNSYWWTQDSKQYSNFITVGCVKTNSVKEPYGINSSWYYSEKDRDNLPGFPMGFGMFVKCVKVQNVILENSISDSGWIKKSITKIQLQNTDTNSYDEIMLFNPGKYIEIKDNNKIRINDLDIFELVVGKQYIGLYNSAEFTNGTKKPVDVPQTDFYFGDLVLKDSLGESGKSGEAGLFFFYSNGKNSALEIRNKICRCAVRIFFTDYQEGMRIEK